MGDDPAPDGSRLVEGAGPCTPPRGDHLVVRSTHVDEPVREGEILEVHGPDGAPPYVVRWSVDGHESLTFPGPDAYVQPSGHDSDIGDPPG